jgi:hypothetical protein
LDAIFFVKVWLILPFVFVQNDFFQRCVVASFLNGFGSDSGQKFVCGFDSGIYRGQFFMLLVIFKYLFVFNSRGGAGTALR